MALALYSYSVMRVFDAFIPRIIFLAIIVFCIQIDDWNNATETRESKIRWVRRVGLEEEGAEGWPVSRPAIKACFALLRNRPWQRCAHAV